MGRSVRPAAPQTRGAMAQADSGESYPEKLVKYFPIETSGPFVIASGAVIAGTAAQTTERKAWLLVVFGVLLAATIVMLIKQYPKSEYRQPWIPVAIGVGAFIIWSYSLNTLPQEFGIYSPVAVIVLPILYGVLANFTPQGKASQDPPTQPPAPPNEQPGAVPQ